MKNIGIIGGGIVGLCSAYYLNKAGHKVTIIDQGDLKNGCSWGNAGMVVPSHFIPLAAPGMISKGIRWMFDSTSPFYVKPRLNADLIRWGYHFYRSATPNHVARAIPALCEISLFSKSKYQQLVKELPCDFGYHERGLLMLYQTAEMEREEAETAKIARTQGIEARVLTPEEVQLLEPDIRVKVRGGVYFPGDAHLTPQDLTGQLIAFLRDKGVEFHAQQEVTGFGLEKGHLKVLKTGREEFSFDEVVVATGAWSGSLCSKLGLSIPMQAGKGYSFTLKDVKNNSRIPSIFVEARVAVTPMGSTLRFGGTMEITGVDHSISMNRVKGIVDAIPKYYPDMQVAVPPMAEVWHGLRPCSPDGLPYIGRPLALKNVIIASGHAMMGMSLGAGTGQLVAEIVDEQKASVPLMAYNPDRF